MTAKQLRGDSSWAADHIWKEASHGMFSKLDLPFTKVFGQESDAPEEQTGEFDAFFVAIRLPRHLTTPNQ